MELTHIYSLVGILFLHWFSDFILQTREMAERKSHSIKWLTYHVVIYSLPFLLLNPIFGVITFITHWITDFITSKVSSSFYKKGNNKGFWAIIGFDQFIHTITLLFTYVWWQYEYSLSWIF